MKVSLNWLSDHVDLAGVTTEKLDHLLTFAGVEVEGITATGANLENIVVAEIIESRPHPGADRLSVCRVDDGAGETKQIVCGATNYRVGDKVPLALPGAVLGKGIKITKGKLRGEVSEGMMCSPGELGVPGDDSGLLILPRETTAGTPLADLFPRDTIFDLEVTPNRPDLLSHRGIAREFAALTSKPLRTPDEPPSSAREDDGSLVAINADARSHCPFYTGRRIHGVKVGPSPAWLRNKLTAVGLRPINNVVDITNYVLMETGQPLHAFDAAAISGHIAVRLAAAGEKFIALDGNEYTLNSDDVLIADDTGALAIGGVMGGENSGVTAETTDVILESAWFTPRCIRRTSRRLNLLSDSSYRFERGVDPEGVLRASALATRLMVEIAGGEAEQTALTAGTPPTVTGIVALDENRARAFLGAALESSEMHRILAALGLSLENRTAGISGWKIPSFRPDLQRHIDLVEEIARIVGLDRIPATLSNVPSEESPEDRAFDLDGGLRNRLADTGFFEIKTIKLISAARLVDHLLALGDDEQPVPLKNPLSDEYAILRPGLAPGLLEVAERNIHQGAKALRLFEMGTVFRRPDRTAAPAEAQHLGVLLAGDAAPASWQEARPRAVDFSDLRGVLESLLPGTSLEVEPEPALNRPSLALAAILTADGNPIGRAGQLLPARARSMDFGHPIYVAELSLAAIHPLLAKPRQYRELDRFPAVTRDIAMEVPSHLPNATLKSFFENCAEPLLVSAELFDVFSDETGAKLSSDKKSLAYSLTYRDKEATLTTGKVDEAHARILDELVRKLPVQIR